MTHNEAPNPRLRVRPDIPFGDRPTPSPSSSTRHLFPVKESPTFLLQLRAATGECTSTQSTPTGSGAYQFQWSLHSPCARRLREQIGRRMAALETGESAASSHRSFPEARPRRQDGECHRVLPLTRSPPLHP